LPTEGIGFALTVSICVTASPRTSPESRLIENEIEKNTVSCVVKDISAIYKETKRGLDFGGSESKKIKVKYLQERLSKC